MSNHDFKEFLCKLQNGFVSWRVYIENRKRCTEFQRELLDLMQKDFKCVN